MSLHHMLRAAAQQQAGGASDPYFEYNTLLLTGDGTNGAQNNTFLDSSTNNFTITRNGNTTQGSFSPYGNLWSNYFDGSGDYLSVPANSVFECGTGDFTIEGWVCPASTADSLTIISSYTGPGSGNWIVWFSGGKLGFYQYPNVPSFNGTSIIPVNVWTHFALVRSSGVTKIYINGVQENSTTAGYALGAGNPLNIGRYAANASSYFNGYISNVRFVKGTAVYTSAFTPSTTPLTAVSGTSLLTCQSNRFIDNSSNNFTLTVNGNTSVQRFSPFNPTAPYSTATIGGSGYFDGTGDYLSTPTTTELAFGTGDFTVSFWLYPKAWANGTTASTCILHGGNSAFQFSQYGATTIGIACADVAWVISDASLPKTDAWSYVVATRVSGTTKIYINGVQSGSSASDSRNYTQITRIGTFASTFANSDYNGYMSDLRIVKGTGVTSVTVPTAPLTAISGTQLLCNFTNAGIPDAAMLNDLETVGNAQVSTSVKKYGTGSLAFDGTGDQLTVSTNPLYSFGTGDFTVECWVYANSFSSPPCIVDARTSAAAIPWAFYINSSGYPYFYNGSSLTSSIAVSTTTWTHIAVARSSGTLKIFVNGVQGYSASITTDMAGGGLQIGGAFSVSYLNGYIDDLRITKGYARYTANFTPPTAALPVY